MIQEQTSVEIPVTAQKPAVQMFVLQVQKITPAHMRQQRNAEQDVIIVATVVHREAHHTAGQ